MKALLIDTETRKATAVEIGDENRLEQYSRKSSKNSRFISESAVFLVAEGGLEPTTSGL